MISEKRLLKLSDRDYREEYLRSTGTAWVVHQMRAMRSERGWTQADLAERLGKPQSAIGRFESESYGNWNANTLYEIANAFDVALQIRFVTWPDFIRWSSDTSTQKMYVPGFDAKAFKVGATHQHQNWPSSYSVWSTMIYSHYRPQPVGDPLRPALLIPAQPNLNRPDAQRPTPTYELH